MNIYFWWPWWDGTQLLDPALRWWDSICGWTRTGHGDARLANVTWMKIGHLEARCDCLVRWVFHGFPIRYPDSLNQTSLTQQFGLQWPYWQALLQVLSQLPPLMWVPGYTVYGKWDIFLCFIDSLQTRWTCDRGSKLIPAEVQAFPISLAVVPPFDVWGALFSWRIVGGRLDSLAVHEKGAHLA